MFVCYICMLLMFEETGLCKTYVTETLIVFLKNKNAALLMNVIAYGVDFFSQFQHGFYPTLSLTGVHLG